ncbi:uncharacterized protein ACJ7VT_010445 isoform 3-T3 [Polymixia lowei]
MSPREKEDTPTSGCSTSHLSATECPTFNGSDETRRRRNKEDGGGREGGEEAEGEEKVEEEEERSSDEGFMGMTPLLQAHHAMEKMEEFVHKFPRTTSPMVLCDKPSGASGVGGPVARHSPRRAPRLAERQRLPAPRPQATNAVVPRLLQEHLQNPHGDGEHLDTSARLSVLPVPGPDVHVQAQHVVRGSGSGEGGDRDVLPGSHSLPLLLLAVPHRLLPLRGCIQSLFQVGLQRDSLPDHGVVRALALLLVLLLSSALLHLSDSGVYAGAGRHHRVAVRLLRNTTVQRSQSRCICGSGSQWCGAHPPLRHQ